jgi:hypothetical protein
LGKKETENETREADHRNITDDPELFDKQPVTLQLVGRGHGEEKLLAVTEVVDAVLNKK